MGVFVYIHKTLSVQNDQFLSDANNQIHPAIERLPALHYCVDFIPFRGSLVRPKRLILGSLAQKTGSLYIFSSLVDSLLPKDTIFKNIFDFTTACGGGRTSLCPSL